MKKKKNEIDIKFDTLDIAEDNLKLLQTESLEPELNQDKFLDKLDAIEEKRGRKKGSKNKITQPEFDLPKGMLAVPFKVLFDTIFKKMGKSELTEQEASALEESFSPVLKKWTGLYLEKYAVEAGFGLTLLTILSVRLIEPSKENISKDTV